MMTLTKQGQGSVVWGVGQKYDIINYDNQNNDDNVDNCDDNYYDNQNNNDDAN